MHPTLAAEFPNDNPELHLGAIWFCRETVGPPVAEVRGVLEAVAASESESESVAVAVAESESESESELESESVAVAVAESESELEAELTVPIPLESVVVLARAPEGELESAVDEIVIEELDFDLSHVPLESAPPEPAPEPVPERGEASSDPYAILVETLVALAVAEGGAEDALRAMLEGSDKAIAEAWGKILRNESDDMTACGAAMLDEWAADLVARAVGAPGKAAHLRRELRARGVCAFGLIEAA